MRIRNRPIRHSPSPLPAPNAPLLILDHPHIDHHHDPAPHKLSTLLNIIESSPATDATNYAGDVKVVRGGKAGNETRGSSKVTRQPPTGGSFPAHPIILHGGASRPAYPSTSTLGDVDVQAAPGSTLASGAVEKEAWQDRARKLSARLLLRKNEGASNVKIMEDPHLVSTRASKVPVKRRKPNYHDELWKEDEESLAVKRKIIKRKKREKTTSKKQISQLENSEGKGKEEALDADTTSMLIKHIRNGKIGSNKTKAGVFIENSRCSRINGRGWRCSQQTLVGYSLCEHHLGKGRLKSMSSLRGLQSAASRMPQTDVINENHHMSLLSSPVDNIGDDQKPLIEAMKGHARKNIGSVKARSMSTLLGVNIAHGSSSAMNIDV